MKLRETGRSRSNPLLLLPLLSLCAGVAVAPLAKAAEKPTDIDTVQVRAKRIQNEIIPWHLFDMGGGGGRWDFLGGGGGGAAPNQTAKEQETDDREKQCDGTTGNPIVLYTGNKVEHELDFASASEMGLFLRRSYNHHWSATGLFGNHWLSNFDYSLAFSNGQSTLWNQRPDGRRIKFQHDPTSGRWNEDKAQPIAYVVKNADGSFTLHNDENGAETYSAEGYITQLRNEQGIAWSFVYNNKYLQTVTHSSGRQVKFTWSGGQVTQVTDPAGNVFQYTYTPNVFGVGRGRLASTTLPGAPATTITYHYEDARYPGGFTGKSFNGVRYSIFAYDENRRAVLSEHAGGVERHTVGYVVESTEQVLPPPAPARPGGIFVEAERGWCEDTRNGMMCYQPRSLPGGSVPLAGASTGTGVGSIQLSSTPEGKARPVKIKAIETNPLGRRTTHAYEDGRPVSVTGAASPRCAASYKESSYDANGYPDLVHDFADNLTDFDYSPQGYLLKRIDAVGTAVQRTTTFEWDTVRNRRTKVSVANDKETSYTYDARGNVASVTEKNLSSHGVPGQSRTTTLTYTYHANGLKASMKVDGPLAQDDVTSVYDANGDLASVTNALGHAIAFSGYNGLGQPARITQVNGQVREYSYDARGRVISQRDSFGNSWGTTTFGYDATGNLASVTRPDGVIERYEYDAARRRLAEVTPLGDGTYAWTRYSYDAASNITRKEVAHTDYPLGSTVTGVIDELTHDGNWNWFLRGWACSTGSNASIEVHGYAEGQFLAAAQANLASEAGVASACQAGGNAYRFQLPVSLAQRQQLGGRKITLYGLSPLGGAHNRALANSGVFAVPQATVVGDIGGVTHDGNGNYAVEGWACSVGVDSSIDVHAYVGGSAGGGAFAIAGTANRPSDGNVANACQAKGSAYWFKLPLDTALRQNHGGKPIYIHGISPVGQANLTINRSGSFTVPPIVRSAEFITFNSSSYHIYNGDRVTLTAQVRNTGNVTWDGNTYLAWGHDYPTQSHGLAAPVPPGGIATFSFDIAPYHDGVGIGGYSYVAQMATSGTAWGPRPYVTIVVENGDWHCPNGPNGPNCQEPMRVTPPIWLDAKEGVR